MQTGTRNAGQGVEWKGRQVCGRCILARARAWSFLDTYRVSLSTLQSEYTTTPVAHFEVTWLVKPKEMSNARTTLGIHVHTSTMNTTSAAQLFAATYSIPHLYLISIWREVAHFLQHTCVVPFALIRRAFVHTSCGLGQPVGPGGAGEHNGGVCRTQTGHMGVLCRTHRSLAFCHSPLTAGVPSALHIMFSAHYRPSVKPRF